MVIKLPVQRPVHQHQLQPPDCTVSRLHFVNIPFVPVINTALVTLHQYQCSITVWVVFSYNTLIRLFCLYTGLIHVLLLTMKENTKNIWHRISLPLYQPQCLSTALQPGPVEVSAGGGAKVARCRTSAADDPSVFGFHNHGEGPSLGPSPRWKRLLMPS